MFDHEATGGLVGYLRRPRLDIAHRSRVEVYDELGIRSKVGEPVSSPWGAGDEEPLINDDHPDLDPPRRAGPSPGRGYLDRGVTSQLVTYDFAHRAAIAESISGYTRTVPLSDGQTGAALVLATYEPWGVRKK